MSIISTTRAAYNRPKPSNHVKRPVASTSQREALEAVIINAQRMLSASTDAAYTLRRSRLREHIRNV